MTTLYQWHATEVFRLSTLQLSATSVSFLSLLVRVNKQPDSV